MAKNVVICIDGTGNEFGSANSNVVKLYSVLDCSDQRQLAYYHPGLGTMGSRSALTHIAQWWTKLIGLAFGYGLSEVLEDCYSFLMEHYEDGDTLFIFGFSRGAYCARALAALLHMYGLVRKGNEPLIRYVLKLFKKKNRESLDFELANKFKSTFSRGCKIHFVGIWDTVSSVGWIYDPVTLPFTAANPDIEVGRHAISIDERRCSYRQNLWREKPTAGQDIQQLWFAGVHSDIGGGYPENESGLSKISLQWLLSEAKAHGLLTNQAREDAVMGISNPKMSRPDCRAELHKSLKGWWWVLEIFPRRYYDVSQERPTIRWKVPIGRCRTLPLNAKIHPSAYQRMKEDSTYRPSNLPKEKN